MKKLKLLQFILLFCLLPLTCSFVVSAWLGAVFSSPNTEMLSVVLLLAPYYMPVVSSCLIFRFCKRNGYRILPCMISYLAIMIFVIFSERFMFVRNILNSNASVNWVTAIVSSLIGGSFIGILLGTYYIGKYASEKAKTYIFGGSAVIAFVLYAVIPGILSRTIRSFFPVDGQEIVIGFVALLVMMLLSLFVGRYCRYITLKEKGLILWFIGLAVSGVIMLSQMLGGFSAINVVISLIAAILGTVVSSIAYGANVNCFAKKRVHCAD